MMKAVCLSMALFCLTLVTYGLDLSTVPVTYEIGTYYSGIRVIKQDQLHGYGVGVHYQDEFYPYLTYSFANMAMVKLGHDLNVDTDDGVFRGVFFDTGVYAKAYLSPLLIQARVLPSLKHVIVSYKKQAGLSYVAEDSDTVSMGALSGFIHVPIYVFDVKARITNRVSNQDQQGLFMTMEMLFDWKTNDIKHDILLGYISSKWNDEVEIEPDYSLDYLYGYYRHIYSLQYQDISTYRVRYCMSIPLDTMTISWDVEHMDSLFLFTLSHEQSIQKNIGLLTQVYGSSVDDDEVGLRMKLIWRE